MIMQFQGSSLSLQADEAEICSASFLEFDNQLNYLAPLLFFGKRKKVWQLQYYIAKKILAFKVDDLCCFDVVPGYASTIKLQKNKSEITDFKFSYYNLIGRILIILLFSIASVKAAIPPSPPLKKFKMTTTDIYFSEGKGVNEKFHLSPVQKLIQKERCTKTENANLSRLKEEKYKDALRNYHLSEDSKKSAERARRREFLEKQLWRDEINRTIRKIDSLLNQIK